jgi:hypothetical protein
MGKNIKFEWEEKIYKLLSIKSFVLLFLIQFIAIIAEAQTYLMYDGGIITTCSGTVYDPGGNNNYDNDLNVSYTICSSTGGPFTLTFTQFNTETNWDVLRIYNGTSALAYSGNTIPPPVTSMGNCITLVFKSDYSFNYSGFVATITCGTVNSCQTYNQNYPFNPTISGSTAISCGNSTTLTSSETDSRWYAQSSGGSPLSSNNSLTVSPTSNTTYYVQREKIMSQTKSFSYSGGQQSWTVPNGVTSINATLYGAKGADATYSNPGYGGKGGKIEANIPVTPGQTLYFFVGSTPTCPNCAGWNGGGNGSSSNSGGGGGASDIRSNGTNLSNRILVAAGGGGGGCYCFSTYGTNGGDGGGLVGGSGVDNNNSGSGGGGGGQNSGGTAGCSGAGGSLGQGGTGTNGGGGGGGGYYGGGAGCFDQGGGGGSSYALGNVTNVIHSFGNNSGFGLITINYTEICVSSRIAVNVTVNSIPAPSNPTSNSPQCNSVTLTRSGTPQTGTTWYWQGTTGNGTSTSLGSGTTYTATSSGTYYIRAQNSAGCWSSTSGSVAITISSNPNAPTTPTSNSPQCTSVIITRSGTPPSGTVWYWQGTNANGTSTTLGSGTTYIATSSGTYYLRAQNSSGCWSSTSASITISITNTPQAPNNPTSNSPQCISSTLTRSGTPPTGTTWYWQGTNANGTSTTLGSGATFTATTSGTHYIRALNSSGCWSSTSGSVSVIISGIPNAPAINTTLPSCTGPGTATISNYNSSQTYNFSPSGPSVGANGLISGMNYNTTYTITTSSSSNCQSGSSNSFSIAPTLIVPITPSVNVVAPNCSSNGIATIINYDNSQTYSFTPSGPTINSSGSIIGATMGISYALTSSNSNCSSSPSQSFSLQNQLLVPNTPAALSSSSTQDICDSIFITRNFNPPTGVIWYWQGTNPSGTSTSFGSGASYYALSSGTYYLRAQSSDGCWSNSSSSIQVFGGRPSTPANPISNAPQCDTMIISFNGTPANDITWYWQGTSPYSSLTIFGSSDTIYITTSGTYYLRALNSWGCWSLGTGSIQVNVGRPSTPNVLTSNSPNCEQVVINRTGAVPSLTGWYWQGTNPNGISTLNSGPSFIATGSGTYHLRARNLNNCWSNQSASINVTVYESSIEQQQVTNCGSYNWIDGQIYSSDTIVTYIYPQTTVNGCDSSIQLILNINPIHSTISDIMACESYTWIDGNTYFSDTLVPAITLNSIYGCDSLVSLNLMIGQPFLDTTIIDTTANQSLVYNGITYSESETYYQTLADQFGCDSIVQINVIIESSGFKELENDNLVIYPNPSSDGIFQFKIKSNYQIEKITDSQGREIQYKFIDYTTLDIQNKQTGVYVISISNGKRSERYKLVIW